MKVIYSFLLAVFFISACGIKGIPQQPVSNKPSPIKNIKVKQQGNRVVFYWNYSNRYEDGRIIEKPVQFFAVDFYKKVKLIKVANKKNMYWFEEKLKPNKKTYCYRFFVKAGKYKSELSDYACILIDENYPPMLKIKLYSEEEGIRVMWNMKTDVNIYKSDTVRIPPVVYKQVKNGTKFLDVDVKLSKNHCYYITLFKNKYLEGVPSKTVCIKYEDTFPPKPPVNGFLQKIHNYVLVFWEDSPSKDVVGYKVYKNKKPLLNFILKTYYIKDKNYMEGDIYYITAIDNAGNESKPLVIR